MGERIGINPYNGRKSVTVQGNGGVIGLGIAGGFISINSFHIQEQCAVLLSMYGGVASFLYDNTSFISGTSETNEGNRLILYNTDNKWFIKNTFNQNFVLYYQVVAGSD